MHSPQRNIKNLCAEHDALSGLLREPLLELLGDERLLIENHKGIRSYAPDNILIGISNGMISVLGQTLRIICMTRDRIVICGRIMQLTIEKGGG